MTICLEPWKFDRVYTLPPKARMARWEPSLDEYERVERSDTTPQFDDHMHQVHGSRTRVPRSRTVRSNRMDDFEYSIVRPNLQTTEGDWYRREFANLWKMNVQVRDDAMDKAGLLI